MINKEIYQNHFSELIAGGFDACEHIENNQQYIEIRKATIKSPPWNKTEVNILIAVPANYNIGGLDAFYMDSQVVLANGQKHPRAQSKHQILGREWWLISWHYQDGKPWSKEDNFITHVQHCRKFFKQGERS